MSGNEVYQARLNGDGTITIPTDVYNSLCESSDILGMAKELFGLEHWEHWDAAILFYESQKDS